VWILRRPAGGVEVDMTAPNAVARSPNVGLSNNGLALVAGFCFHPAGLKPGTHDTSTEPDDNNNMCVAANAGDMALAINRIITNNGGRGARGRAAPCPSCRWPSAASIA